jgi:uncharacterized metal-binding protein
MKRAVAHLNPGIRRRALVLLASCPDGCTKAILAAHNISDDIVRRLIRSGLAAANTDARRGEDGLETSRVRITEVGKGWLSRSAAMWPVRQ